MAKVVHFIRAVKNIEKHTTILEAQSMLRRAHKITLRIGNLWVDRLSDRPGRKQAVVYYIPEQVDKPFPYLCAQAFPREFRFNFYRRSAIAEIDWSMLRHGPNQMPKVSSNDVSDAEIEQILRRYITASSPYPVREYRYWSAMYRLLENALPQYRFVKERLDDMRNPRTQCPLELDFFCRTIGFAIEVQGEHHYMPVSYRNDEKTAMDRLEDRKKLDKLKAEYCLERGIGLIQVKADQFERQVTEALSIEEQVKYFLPILKRIIEVKGVLHWEGIGQETYLPPSNRSKK